MARRFGLSQRKFERAALYTERNIRALEAMSALDDAVLEGIVENAAEEVTPVVRQIIGRNKRAAGIGTETGTLDSNIRKVVVVPRVEEGGFSLLVTFPNDVRGYKGGGKEQFFKAAQSIHSGRVILPQVERTTGDIVSSTSGQQRRAKLSSAGRRAKKTIKKLALTGEISDRARNAVEEGRRYKTGVETSGVHLAKRGETETTVKYAGATVVKPRPFFELTPSQERSVLASVLRRVADLIFGKMQEAA